MNNRELLNRITINPNIFGGKPIIRNRRMAVEHIIDLLKAGDTEQSLLQAYPWLEAADIQACVLYEKQHHGRQIAQGQ